jgi:hypothetical protein
MHFTLRCGLAILTRRAFCRDPLHITAADDTAVQHGAERSRSVAMLTLSSSMVIAPRLTLKIFTFFCKMYFFDFMDLKTGDVTIPERNLRRTV